MKFLPPFLLQKIEVYVALILNFQFKHFFILPKLTKMQVSFSKAWNWWYHKVGNFRSCQCISYKATIGAVFFGDFIQWKMSSDIELSHSTSPSSDVESLQSVGEGEGPFNSTIQPYKVKPNADIKEWDLKHDEALQP